MITSHTLTPSGRCSDCARLAQDLAEVFDGHTGSQSQLCPNCLPF